MRSFALIAALSLLAATSTLAAEVTRSPAPALSETAPGSTAEGIDSQLFMRGVSVDLTPLTATLTIGTLTSHRIQSSGALRLELWATTQPPVYGESVDAHIVATADLPFTLQGGETRLNVTTGELPFTPPSQAAFYLTLALLEYYPGNFG